jgi:UDP-glucose 4-epimerase
VDRYLVTGGAGFIGSHLVEALLAQGGQVRILDDLSTGNLNNLRAVADRVELRRGSVTDADAVQAAVADCQVVFHLAALPSVTLSVEEPLRIHEACATGTLRILDAARRHGVRRVVYAASSSAYGDQPGAERSEGDALLPLSPYAAAKLAGEHYCSACTAAYGLETVRLRFFNVFGPRQDAQSPYSGVIALFIAALAAGRQPTIFGDGLQARDFVYVANAVEALLKAAKATAAVGQVYNIGNGQSTTVLELVQQLNELTGQKIQPIHAAPRPGDVRFSQADIRRAARDLGYAPAVTFRQGLVRTLEAHRGR